MRNTKIIPFYERLSRDDEFQDERNSILNPKKMLEDYARRNGFPNPTHFTDDGISGTRIDRPALYSHLLLSEKLYPHLLEIDRLANERLAQLMPQMIKAAGITKQIKATDQ